MKFGIYSNLTRDIKGKSAFALADLLNSKKIDFVLSEELAEFNFPCKYANNEDLAKNSDVVILFGGDGTVLHYAKICAKYDTPIFAVNVGRVGFLTESENIDLNEIVNRIKDGNYKLENRSLLKINALNSSYIALNDCVISRGPRASLIDLEYRINNYLTEHIRSDALIISTPTGSTAYSLSCGGSIVAPSVNGILITPVSAYTLNSRPLIVSDDSKIEIETKKACAAYLSIDGEDILEINEGEKVLIQKADINAKFIRLDDGSFYKKLLKKISVME